MTEQSIAMVNEGAPDSPILLYRIAGPPAHNLCFITESRGTKLCPRCGFWAVARLEEQEAFKTVRIIGEKCLWCSWRRHQAGVLKDTPRTDEELLAALKELPISRITGKPVSHWASDPGTAHLDADILFLELLEALDFPKSVQFYREQTRYYD